MTYHAIDRAMERIGRQFTQADLDAILEECLHGSAVYLRRQEKNAADVYRVEYDGDTLYPVVAKPRKAGAASLLIVTFLAPGMVDRARKKPRRGSGWDDKRGHWQDTVKRSKKRYV